MSDYDTDGTEDTRETVRGDGEPPMAGRPARGKRFDDREMARPSREHESRDGDPVHGFAEFDFTEPPQFLLAPDSRPGMDQRWVASKVLGQDVPLTYSQQIREGWRPRDPSTIEGFQSFRIGSGDHAGCIGVDGLILCERPKEISRKFRARIDEQNRLQEMSVEEQIRQTAEQGGVPISVQRKSTTKFGRRAVQVAPDEDGDDE